MSGSWFAVLRTPGHEIHFNLDIPGVADEAARVGTGFPGSARAVVGGGADELILTFPGNESRIVATRVGESLYGEWRRDRVVSGRVIVERVPFQATRTPSEDECGGVISEQLALPRRWISEADECGSSTRCVLTMDAFGSVTLQAVGPDSRVATYAGMWDSAAGTLWLTRFDGIEAQVIHAARHADGSFEGLVWTGPNMPLRWVIRPTVDWAAGDAVGWSSLPPTLSSEESIRSLP